MPRLPGPATSMSPDSAALRATCSAPAPAVATSPCGRILTSTNPLRRPPRARCRRRRPANTRRHLVRPAAHRRRPWPRRPAAGFSDRQTLQRVIARPGRVDLEAHREPDGHGARNAGGRPRRLHAAAGSSLRQIPYGRGRVRDAGDVDVDEPEMRRHLARPAARRRRPWPRRPAAGFSDRQTHAARDRAAWPRQPRGAPSAGQAQCARRRRQDAAPACCNWILTSTNPVRRPPRARRRRRRRARDAAAPRAACSEPASHLAVSPCS